jgi:hypothetical protein
MSAIIVNKLPKIPVIIIIIVATAANVNSGRGNLEIKFKLEINFQSFSKNFLVKTQSIEIS